MTDHTGANTAPVSKGINPRYLAYCTAHGRTVDEMRAHDEERWPGGRACGFILWMSATWQAWDKLHGYKWSEHVRSSEEYDRFDAWLPTCGITLEESR